MAFAYSTCFMYGVSAGLSLCAMMKIPAKTPNVKTFFARLSLSCAREEKQNEYENHAGIILL